MLVALFEIIPKISGLHTNITQDKHRKLYLSVKLEMWEMSSTYLK